MFVKSLNKDTSQSNMTLELPRDSDMVAYSNYLNPSNAINNLGGLSANQQ